MTDPRVAVLASGEGTNVQALLDDPVVGPWVALVLSDRGEARALERARAAGVPTLTLHVPGGGRDAFDEPLLKLLRDQGIDLVALAGFMRIVGPRFVAGYAGRIINVHPSLLPAFPGTSAVADALAWGVKMTGVTVHLVDEDVDHGPVVFQEAVRVEPDDDWNALEARIHEIEHRLLPAAVRAIGERRVKVDGRRVRVLDEAPA